MLYEKAVGVSLIQVDPADVIIVEGILVLYMQELRDQCNMKIYVDTGTGADGCIDTSGGLCVVCQILHWPLTDSDPQRVINSCNSLNLVFAASLHLFKIVSPNFADNKADASVCCWDPEVCFGVIAMPSVPCPHKIHHLLHPHSLLV